MKTSTLPVVIEREGRNYYAYSDDYPTVYGMGRSIQEAKASLVWALQIHLRRHRAQPEPGPDDEDTAGDGHSK